MKRTLFTKTILFSYFISIADGTYEIEIFSRRDMTIKQNPIFIIEGFSFSEDIVKQLGTTYPIYLIVDNQRVSNVQKITPPFERLFLIDYFLEKNCV